MAPSLGEWEREGHGAAYNVVGTLLGPGELNIAAFNAVNEHPAPCTSSVITPKPREGRALPPPGWAGNDPVQKVERGGGETLNVAHYD